MGLLDKTPFMNRFRSVLAVMIFLFASNAYAQDAEMESYIKRIVDKTYTLENLITSNAQRIDYLLQVLKEDHAELPKQTPPEEREKLKLRIAKVKKLNQEAQKIRKKAEKNVKHIEKLSQTNDESVYNHVEDIKSKVDELGMFNVQLVALVDESLVLPTLNNQDNPEPERVVEIEQVSTEPKQTETSTQNTTEAQTEEQAESVLNTDTQKKYAQYSRKQDVLYHPPNPACDQLVDDIDPFTGKARRLTQHSELFHFTNAFMANAMRGKDHITCFASIIESQKKTFLHLKFVILDANGARNFGSIRQDVPIIIKLVDETKVPLNNGLTDAGQMDASGSVYTVSASMQLWKAERDALAKLEIDRIRIPWQKGFEEYEIYNVALIQRMLACF
jgi:hypothetical protein